jgi:hypothetical protein
MRKISNLKGKCRFSRHPITDFRGEMEPVPDEIFGSGTPFHKQNDLAGNPDLPLSVFDHQTDFPLYTRHTRRQQLKRVLTTDEHERKIPRTNSVH